MNFTRFVAIAGKDFELIKKFAKRENTLLGITLEDITFLTYDELKHKVPDMFNKGEFEKAIHLILKHKKKNLKFGNVKRTDNYKKYQFLLWLMDQYDRIGELEQTYLVSPPDPKLLSAGIRDLDVLGEKNLIDSLANGDILKWNEVIKLPYHMIFDKQLKTTIERRIAKRLEEIQLQEIKNKR